MLIRSSGEKREERILLENISKSCLFFLLALFLSIDLSNTLTKDFTENFIPLSLLLNTILNKGVC